MTHGGGVWQLVAVVGHHVSRACLVTCQGVQVTRVHGARVKHDAVILLGAAPAVNPAVLEKENCREKWEPGGNQVCRGEILIISRSNALLFIVVVC